MARASVQMKRQAMQAWTKSVSGSKPAIVAKLPSGHARALAISTVAMASNYRALARHFAPSAAPIS